MAEYAHSIISQYTGTKLYANNGVNGVLWETKDGWVVGGAGLCKKKRLPRRQLFEVALVDETFSSTCHEGNDLVSVTFISLSVGNSFSIVVFFVLASETHIINPFKNKLT